MEVPSRSQKTRIALLRSALGRVVRGSLAFQKGSHDMSFSIQQLTQTIACSLIPGIMIHVPDVMRHRIVNDHSVDLRWLNVDASFREEIALITHILTQLITLL